MQMVLEEVVVLGLVVMVNHLEVVMVVWEAIHYNYIHLLWNTWTCWISKILCRWWWCGLYGPGPIGAGGAGGGGDGAIRPSAAGSGTTNTGGGGGGAGPNLGSSPNGFQAEWFRYSNNKISISGS